MNQPDPAKRYRSARGNLLVMVIMTAVNIGLSVANSGRAFLFRAFLPELAIDFFSDIVPWAGFTIAALLLGLYLLCWALSKKQSAWMTAALVLFAMDTAVFLALFASICLAGKFAFGMLLEVAFQAWVLYYLIIGVLAAKELKDMPEAELIAQVEPLPCPAQESVPLRERGPKGRSFLRHVTEDGLEIEVLNTLRTIELIADGMVYAEFRGLIVATLDLAARVRGHDIRVTMDLSAMMELYVDGILVRKKHKF